jgi:hypothetical protein
MPARENASPEKQTARSLIAALMIATVAVFGLLHVVGIVLLHEQAAPRTGDITDAMMNRD